MRSLAEAGVAGYSRAFLETVEQGLRVLEAERPQSVDEWLAQFADTADEAMRQRRKEAEGYPPLPTAQTKVNPKQPTPLLQRANGRKVLGAVLLLPLSVAVAILQHQLAFNICDRTPAVRDAILSAIDADDCATVDRTDLHYVRGPLSLVADGIGSLRVGDFDGLGSLERVFLYGDRLTSLPAGVFDGLGSLEGLELSGNRLTTLPVGAFDGLGNLTSLGLLQNQLTTLPVGVFDGLGRLEILRLQGNHLVGLGVDDPAFDAVRSANIHL